MSTRGMQHLVWGSQSRFVAELSADRQYLRPPQFDVSSVNNRVNIHLLLY